MDGKKLLEYVDFREIPIPEALLQLSVSEETLDQAVAALGPRFATFREAGDGIRSGDIVVITTEAPVEADPNGADYRHEAQAVPGQIQINVGKGFYDPAFEEGLLGKKIGDTLTLPKRGQGKRGIIAQVKRKENAPVTDDLAQRMGAGDLGQYREMMRAQYLEGDMRKKLNGIQSLLTKTLRERCVFGDIEEEIAQSMAEMRAYIQNAAEEKGLPYAEVEAKLLPDGCVTEEAKAAFFRGKAEEGVKDKLISRAAAEHDGAVFDRAGYEALMAQYTAMGMPAEQFQAQMPFERYQIMAPENYLPQAMQAYFEEKFKAVIL